MSPDRVAVQLRPGWHLSVDGVIREPGDVFDADRASAERLVRRGFATLVEPAKIISA